MISPVTHIKGSLTMLVRQENEKRGTRDWMLTKTRVDPATKYRCPWVEGFCSRASVRAGEEISFFVNTNPPSPFRIDFYRTGYYGGAGGRHVMSHGPFPGHAQPDPPVGERRLRAGKGATLLAVKLPPGNGSRGFLRKRPPPSVGVQAASSSSSPSTPQPA